MLSELTANSVADAEARRAERPLAEVEAAALARPPAIDALAALAPGDRVKVIAEIKRSSPSRGSLATIDDPAALARTYELGGASAIYKRSPLQRICRDAQVATQHLMVAPPTLELTGRMFLGLPTDTGSL